ncbi:MAG: hypothetical protein IKG90_02660 [Bacteroidales bacterium]|nr:hypothetical protein [Bacteroidales bacterium]
MKRFFLIVVAIILVSSCSNGLNKSIIEPLSVDELKANMKDSTFVDFYSLVQEMSDWIKESDIRQAQYGDITYRQVRKFMNHYEDTAYFSKKRKVWKEEYDKVYPNYDQQVDSIMNYWRDYTEQYNMDSLVTIEFSKLWKEYYSYSGGIRAVNIGFLITPLKGKIDQLVFRYEMKTKVNNDGSISVWNGHRCVASAPVSSPKVLYWEADYSDEKKLQHLSNEEVKRDYDFNFEIVNVRINGENYEDKLKSVPEPVYMAIKYCKPDNNYYADDIIKLLIDPNYQDFYDYIQPFIEEDMKKTDSEVFTLFKAMEKDNDD